jgi:hypothetical protein
MNAKRLIGSLLVGLAFASLTWVMIGAHPHSTFHPIGGGVEYLGEAIMISLLPGLFARIAVSSNIHNFNVWVVATGNFIFYVGATYFILANLEKRKEKSHRLSQTPKDMRS